jgi:DNA-binding transcriptional MerR regulator
MKKILPQIAIDFIAVAGSGQPQPAVPAQVQEGEYPPVAGHSPAGVGIRIKSLKNTNGEALTSTLEGTKPDGDNEREINTIDGSDLVEGQAISGEAVAVVPDAKNAAKSKRGRKSLKQATAEADLIDIPGDEILFSKQYYTMGEVAEMFRVNQSLLRFWETEFDILQPRKNKKGDRYFRPADIKNLHLIHHLLRQRKYTIEGAKEFLKKNKKAEVRFEAIQRLQQIKAFLLEWKAQL